MPWSGRPTSDPRHRPRACAEEALPVVAAAALGAGALALLAYVAVRPYFEAPPARQRLQLDVSFPQQLSFGFDSFLVLSPEAGGFCSIRTVRSG